MHSDSFRGTCYTDSSRRTKGVESISAQIMDLHTDVADLDAKESFLDRMIASCRTELKNLTEDSVVAKYPFYLFSCSTCVHFVNHGFTANNKIATHGETYTFKFSGVTVCLLIVHVYHKYLCALQFSMAVYTAKPYL